MQIDELAVPLGSPFIGKTIRELEVRGRGGFIAIALRKQEGTIVRNLDHNTLLEKGDTVIVMGHQGDIPQFARANKLKSKLRYRGSQVGQYYYNNY
ncbi:MAG: hypothetical protein Kow0049_00630 [Stanieria sp.]